VQLLFKRVVFCFFGGLFLWIGLMVFFIKRPGVYGEVGLNTFLLFILTAFACALIYFICRALKRIPFTKWHGMCMLTAFVVLSAVVQILVGLRLRYLTYWDIDAVFGGARNWALNGNFDQYMDYYARVAPNNSFAMFLLMLVFKVYSLFGGTDFFAVAVIFTVLLLQASTCALYGIAKQVSGVSGGIITLFLLAVFLPFYTMGAAFYTDILSLPFVPLIVYFYLRGCNENKFSRKLFFFVACGFFAAIGALIKFTVIIVLIACVIDWVLNNKEWNFKHLKSRLPALGAGICVAVLLIASFFAYFDSLLDEQAVYENRLPTSHYFMMGLNHNDGLFSQEDQDFTMSLPNLDDRKKEIPPLILERVKEHGFGGLIAHFSMKFYINYQSGTLAQGELFRLSPQNETALHDIVLYDGCYFPVYNHMVTAQLLAYIFFGLIGVFIFFRKSKFCVPWLALVGMTLFLMVWESGNRFIASSFPLILLCAALSLANIDKLHRPKKSEQDKAELEAL